MKPLNLATCIAVLALPLFAVEQPRQNPPVKTLAQPASAQAQDSPLVRAAKACGQAPKKASVVITNENLVRSGVQFTTTTSNNPIPEAPKPNPVAEAAKIAIANAEAKAKAEAGTRNQQKLRNVASDYYGESIENRIDDPAMQEHVMQQMTSTQPQTATPSKPPQE
jgi:hypothetical protein